MVTSQCQQVEKQFTWNFNGALRKTLISSAKEVLQEYNCMRFHYYYGCLKLKEHHIALPVLGPFVLQFLNFVNSLHWKDLTLKLSGNTQLLLCVDQVLSEQS